MTEKTNAPLVTLASTVTVEHVAPAAIVTRFCTLSTDAHTASIVAYWTASSAAIETVLPSEYVRITSKLLLVGTPNGDTLAASSCGASRCVRMRKDAPLGSGTLMYTGSCVTATVAPHRLKLTATPLVTHSLAASAATASRQYLAPLPSPPVGALRATFGVLEAMLTS